MPCEVGNIKLYVDVAGVSGYKVSGSVLFVIGASVEPDMVKFVYEPGHLLVLVPKSWLNASEKTVKAVVGEIGAKICDDLESKGFKVCTSTLSIGVS